MATNSFVSIDFETMTAERTSGCALGMVRVEGGIITRKYYTLINPIPDDRTVTNAQVHGITPEMVSGQPTFGEIYPAVRDFVGGLPLVCHNRNMDMNVLESMLSHYGISTEITSGNYCTFELTGLSLEECCKRYSIDMGAHHDALDDATACAKVFLAAQGNIIADTFRGGIKRALQELTAKRYEHSTLEKLDESEVENKDTAFYGSRVVITGVFDSYPDRNELGKKLQKLGADINTSISKRTDIVVAGHGAGPSKLKKIEDLNAQGNKIRIMYENELKEILSGI